jgi:DNA-binding FrmR family transcriptional regulator
MLEVMRKMGCDKCGKCCMQNEKKTYRTEDEKNKLSKRLDIIESKIKEINEMVSNDRYCEDILTQIADVTNSLKDLGNNVLDSHLKSCVAYEVQMGNLDVLDDVMLFVKKLQ